MDKILNPTTGRYVKKNGALGKKLLQGYIPPEKPCGMDKVKNPKTKRCVDKSGKIGKKIINATTTETVIAPIPDVKQPFDFKKSLSNIFNFTDEELKNIDKQDRDKSAMIIQKAYKNKKLYDIKSLFTKELGNQNKKKQPESATIIQGAIRRQLVKDKTDRVKRLEDALKQSRKDNIFYDVPQYTRKERIAMGKDKADKFQKLIKESRKQKALRLKELKSYKLAPSF